MPVMFYSPVATGFRLITSRERVGRQFAGRRAELFAPMSPIIRRTARLSLKRPIKKTRLGTGSCQRPPTNQFHSGYGASAISQDLRSIPRAGSISAIMGIFGQEGSATCRTNRRPVFGFAESGLHRSRILRPVWARHPIKEWKKLHRPAN